MAPDLFLYPTEEPTLTAVEESTMTGLLVA